MRRNGNFDVIGDVRAWLADLGLSVHREPFASLAQHIHMVSERAP